MAIPENSRDGTESDLGQVARRLLGFNCGTLGRIRFIKFNRINVAIPGPNEFILGILGILESVEGIQITDRPVFQ